MSLRGNLFRNYLSGRRAFALLVGMAFVTALFWAKARDPFRRIEFSLGTAGGINVKGMAVVPRSAESRKRESENQTAFPVAIYLHGSGGSLLDSGNDLRQLAELNLAAVDIEYDQTNQAAFDEELIALHQYLSRQRWAQTNAVAWIGFSLGAQRALSFLLRHPQLKPQLLVRLSGDWVQELEGNSESGKPALTPYLFHPVGEGIRRTAEATFSTGLHVLLIHGENDEVFPVANCRRLAELLRTNGVPVDLRIFPSQPHGFGTDRPAVMRGVSEYCASFLDTNSMNHHESPHPLRINTRPLYLHYWLPVGLLAVVVLLGGYWRWRITLKAAGVPGDNWSKAILFVAWVLASAAIAETAVHLGLPCLQISETRLNLTRRWLVEPPGKDDFDWLARKPIWNGQKLGAILEHMELASLQRKFFYSELDETMYRDFILSPVVGNSAGDLDWRRALWESFYPRIRHETNPLSAAQVVVRFLRERVTIIPGRFDHDGVREIWERELADPVGFERIYVAALRSVGIAARLDAEAQAELFANGKWQPAPRPIIYSFLPEI